MLTQYDWFIVFFQVFSLLTVIYLIVGMIRPNWVWLGNTPPNRLIISAIALLSFMLSWTGYSEFRHRKLLANPNAAVVVQQPTAQQSESDALQKALQAAPVVPPPVVPNKP